MAVRTFGIANQTNSAEDYRLTQAGLYVPASALNVRTGSLVAPTLTGTGAFTCQVSPCSVVIDGTSNSLQAGYAATLDLAATVTISAAGTQARTDLICLQIQDDAYDGSGQRSGQVLYVQGAAGGGIPSTPTSAIPLFTVPVPANAASINFSTATAVFPYTAAAGGIVPARSSADKPAVANAVQYRHRLDVGAGGVSPLEWSTNGTTWTPVYDPNTAVPTAWTTYTPAWTSNGAAPSLGNGTLSGYYYKLGRLVYVQIDLTIRSTTTFGTGAWNFSVPFPIALPLNQGALGQSNGLTAGNEYVGFVVNNFTGVSAVYGSIYLDPTHPATWGTDQNTNYLHMVFQYLTSG